MKIRIFALAKELGLDSKILIDLANEAGVSIKNSALASVSPAERDTILQHIEGKKSSENVATTHSSEPAAPLREAQAGTSRKIRAINTASNAGSNQTTVIDSPDQETADVEEYVEADSADSADSADDLPESPQEAATDTETIVSPEVDDKTTDVDEVAATDEIAATDKTAEAEPESDSDSQKDGKKKKPKKKTKKSKEPAQTAPIQPGDYVPPTGSHGSTIREMKPRGTLPTDSAAARRPKQKAKQVVLPNVAATPNYVPPKAKPAAKKEQAAQKPDIPLTADVLASDHSPLRQHLKQHRKKESGPQERTKQTSRRGQPEENASAQTPRKERRRSRRFQQDDSSSTVRHRTRRRRKNTKPVVLKTEAAVEVPCTIRAFSEAIGRPANLFIKSLFQKGQMMTMNDIIDEEIALELALEVGVDLEIKHPRDVEQELIASFEQDDSDEALVSRPPIITILGHVDHGKTTLLDKIRSGNVADGEAGGITQHIASYQVEHGGKKLTFVDTPGHAAFGEMRARGAGVTDIVVLVVAADDGVMPQTIECISHARAAGVPMIVAMNKIDLPEINEQKVLQELAAQNVLPAEWGGDIEVVRTSAETGQGLDDLLETLLLTAELHEYKANPERDATGVCLEAFMDEGRGSIAWLVVQKGTLRVGDLILCGEAYGRVRAIYDDHDVELSEAGPSMPVKITGLNIVPDAGEHFFVVDDIEKARQTAENRHHRGRAEVLSTRGVSRTLEDILSDVREGSVQDLPLILKADTPGSLEALRGELGKFDHPEVRVEIVHSGVGGVNESDVALASASGAIIIAFHVIPEDRAEQLAAREGVDIRRYQIIYEVTETIRNSLEGLLVPEKVEKMTGRALVLQTFKVTRFGVIAGCRILNGTIDRTNRVRVIRDQAVLNDYNIASLRREKDDVKEVREGMECGIRLDGFNDVKQGDLFEAFRIDEVKRTLESPTE